MSKASLLSELRELCDPQFMMSDSERVERFTKLGEQTVMAFEVISNACTQLNRHIGTLIDIHAEEVKALERQLNELKRENRTLKKLDNEAHVALIKPMKMRTNFTGEFPYHGWKGIGRALEEVLDQRDMYRATLEEIQEEFAERQPDFAAIKAMTRGVLKMTHRKEDA